MVRGRLLPLVGAATVALGLAAEAAAYELDQPGRWVPDLVTGWTLAACGVLAWARRPDSPSGALLALTGATWFLGNFDAALAHVHRGPLVHLLLAHPTGRAPAGLVAGGYLAAVTPGVWGNEPATIVLAVLLVAAVLVVHRPGIGRAHVPALRATAVLAVVLVGGAVARLLVAYGAETPALLAYQLGLCVVAVLIATGLLQRTGEQAALADLVIELGSSRSGALQEALARALGDPTVQVGFRLPETGAFVDAAGRPLPLPDADSARSVTFVEQDGEPIAALVHDPAVLRDIALVDALGTATALSARHAQLQAAVRAQVDELATSTRRLVDAAEVERRRLEQLLRDGAQQRLDVIAAGLAGLEGARAEQARDQLDAAISDLHELAAGLHPRALTEKGLAGAVRELGERSPIPVAVSSGAGSLPQAVESAAYFMCAEALANVVKHSGATRATIEVRESHGRLMVQVSDDGAGGADPLHGSGLRGLADRVAALGGSLQLESPPGAGTRLSVELPLSRSS